MKIAGLGSKIAGALPALALGVTFILLLIWIKLSIGSEVRAYLAAHPEAIAQAMNMDRARQQAADDGLQEAHIRANWSKLAATPVWVAQYDGRVIRSRLSTLGREFDPSTLNLIATDYRCHFCQGDSATVEAMIKAHQDKKYAFLEAPILGDPSLALADDVLRKAGGQDYFALHQNGFVRGRETANAAAGERGQPLSSILSAQIAAEQLIGITGTPTYVLDGKLRARALSAQG